MCTLGGDLHISSPCTQRVRELKWNLRCVAKYFMCSQLAGYENDFKIERQEKVKALSDCERISRERDQLVQRYEQLKQEHIGLRQNIERMYTQAQAQQQQVRVIKS